MPMRAKLKVKTGCITCRRRKLKCDEEKPFCNRCKASRRTCDGYPDANTSMTSFLISEEFVGVVSSKPRGQKFLPGLVSSIGPLTSLHLDDEESRWFQFFSSRTGPALTPFSDDHAFWSEQVPAFGLEEPAIRHALIAVASFHARLEPIHCAVDASQSAGYGKFTIKHYNLALRALQQAIDSESSRFEVALVCCLLFVVLECLYGNHLLALKHLQHGFNILKLPRFQVNDESEHLLMKKKIEQIFTKLVAHSTLFGEPAVISASRTRNDDDDSIGSPHCGPFFDMIDAKSCLDATMSASLHFVRSLHDDFGELKQPATPDDQISQQRLRNGLVAWEQRLEASENMSPQRFSPDDCSVILLKIEHLATFIYLAQCEFEESPFDTHRADFVRILELCRTFSEKHREENSPTATMISKAFSLHSGCVPALFLTAFKCRDPLLRREAIAMLEAHPRREGLWDAALHAKISRRVVEIEEASMLCFEGAQAAAMEAFPSTQMVASNGAVMVNWPLERFRIRNIARTSEEPTRSAHITFFTAPDGVGGQLVHWDEDLEL